MKAKLLGGVAPSPCREGNLLAPEPEAVSVEDARRLLGIGRTKFYELVRDGVLPTVKIGRRRLVRTSTARGLLAGLEQAGVERRVSFDQDGAARQLAGPSRTAVVDVAGARRPRETAMVCVPDPGRARRPTAVPDLSDVER